jgi:hypothetical protein
MSDDESAPVSPRAKGSTASGGDGTSKEPVFFKVPMGWKDMSEEEKDRFLDKAALALMKHSQLSETVGRKPVFGKIPSNWSELTQEQKNAWGREFLDAATAAAAPEDRPTFEEQDDSGVGQS